jgi:hypothetical protein
MVCYQLMLTSEYRPMVRRVHMETPQIGHLGRCRDLSAARHCGMLTRRYAYESTTKAHRLEAV